MVRMHHREAPPVETEIWFENSVSTGTSVSVFEVPCDESPSGLVSFRRIPLWMKTEIRLVPDGNDKVQRVFPFAHALADLADGKPPYPPYPTGISMPPASRWVVRAQLYASFLLTLSVCIAGSPLNSPGAVVGVAV